MCLYNAVFTGSKYPLSAWYLQNKYRCSCLNSLYQSRDGSILYIPMLQLRPPSPRLRNITLVAQYLEGISGLLNCSEEKLKQSGFAFTGHFPVVSKPVKT